MNDTLLRSAVAEFLGTFTLVFVSAAVVSTVKASASPAPDQVPEGASNGVVPVTAPEVWGEKSSIATIAEVGVSNDDAPRSFK